jgi:hypothetical protein
VVDDPNLLQGDDIGTLDRVNDPFKIIALIFANGVMDVVGNDFHNWVSESIKL